MANVRLRQERPFRKPPAVNEICAFKPAENDPVEADPLVWVAMERPLKALRQIWQSGVAALSCRGEP